MLFVLAIIIVIDHVIDIHALVRFFGDLEQPLL